ncbi:hypothetical protein N7470_000572 [Penicillium chermesinum]|nr:hypothetical protein N7470_000572 [Penicillium chermesinum]
MFTQRWQVRIKVDQRVHDCASCSNHETEYTRILKEEAQMNWRYNVSASAANWILLAGYLVVPATFTSLNDSTAVEKTLQANDAGRAVLRTIRNPPLLAIACLFFVVGATLLGYLFVCFRKSYSWVVNKIFLPGCMNAVAGLLTTLVSVLANHSGECSIMAIMTFVVTGTTSGIFLILSIWYKFFLIQPVVAEDLAESHGETFQSSHCSCADDVDLPSPPPAYTVRH